MAKKSFKQGLGTLIQDTRNKTKEPDLEVEKHEAPAPPVAEPTDDYVKWLKIKMQRQEIELKNWRTGKLTPQLFTESLKEHQLQYNPANNSFIKLP